MKGKAHGDLVKVNGTRPDGNHENEEGEGEDQEPNTPTEEAMTPNDDHPSTFPSDLQNGKAYTNGVVPEDHDTERSTVLAQKTNVAKDDENGSGRVADSSEGTHMSHVSRESVVKNSTDDTEARLEALAQEREALREQVAELRRSLEEIQDKHDEDMNAVRSQLNDRTEEKEQAETQYRNLLGKVNTIRSQLGERLKADAVGLVAEINGGLADAQEGRLSSSQRSHRRTRRALQRIAYREWSSHCRAGLSRRRRRAAIERIVQLAEPNSSISTELGKRKRRPHSARSNSPRGI